ncbi:ATP-binding protein [Polluticoccus soli]|uniref:PAS domain-containing sensor histidine kinase n=1 Tax=Polluticoccus soli TaxID=3034150 RepID=UPI0023E17C78|nr:ATP-binding protein [Flavipsychrobacter sp. JY13-12]
MVQIDNLADMINDASIDQVLAFDTQMQVISWNKTCEQFSGISKNEIMGRNLIEFFPEINNHEEVIKAIDMAMRGFKTFVPAGKGSYGGGYFESHFIPLKDDRGEVFGVMNIKHDVSHRIKAENELKNLNKALVRKNKELKQTNADLLTFTHVTSHDLKEPLRKIYTFVEMILTEDGRQLSEKSKGYFKRIQSSAQRMGLLTDDLLTFAQVNDDDTEREETDLNQLLQHAKVQLDNVIARKKAIIESGELPNVTGNAKLLTQMMVSIISNALKFQEEGSVPHIVINATIANGIDLKHPDALDGTNYHRISFKDNGIGFDSKYTNKIFQMFQRLHSSSKYFGTGIGLALCQKILDKHNGFITVESEPGKGSTFNVFLPVE